MSTPQDLMIVSMDVPSSPPVEPGDLSLALAGAEVIDLLGARAVILDGDRLVPADGPATGDHLLDQAASALVDQEPYESVEDWLWRRGRNLSSVYRGALQATGLTAVSRPGGGPGPPGSRCCWTPRPPGGTRPTIVRGARPCRPRVRRRGPRGPDPRRPRRRRRRRRGHGAGRGPRRRRGTAVGAAAEGHREGGLRQHLAGLRARAAAQEGGQRRLTRWGSLERALPVHGFARQGLLPHRGTGRRICTPPP